jgi:cytoskeletal protein CcmA (bactofilin family)
MFSPTLIPYGTHFNGKLNCHNDCVIRGTFKGEIFANETVFIEKGGSFEGYIHAPLLVVEGFCKGVIHCDKVKILPKGELRGEIRSHFLIMHPQSLFEGTRVLVAKEFEDEIEDKKRMGEFDTENILL